jgi:tetratricopeptide (TPR) repeat protein
MKDLQREDAMHLRAAEGWLELGLMDEALAEVEQISESTQHHPLALILLWRVYSQAGKWRKCVEVADELVQREPGNSFGWIHRSYALHELKRTQEAASLLEPAIGLFSDEELIPYNLACYACQLGKLSEAKAFLEVAFKRGKRAEIKERALEDADLFPLRDYIRDL